jgi:MftR C-terminal domain
VRSPSDPMARTRSTSCASSSSPPTRPKRSELDEQLHRVVESDETLRSHMRARFAQLEELVAAAIAVDLGVGENDVRPQVVAASMVAAFDGLFDSESKTKPRSADEVAALIDPVMTFLRGGLEALKRPR